VKEFREKNIKCEGIAVSNKVLSVNMAGRGPKDG
jgi:hypothetical protein